MVFEMVLAFCLIFLTFEMVMHSFWESHQLNYCFNALSKLRLIFDYCTPQLMKLSYYCFHQSLERTIESFVIHYQIIFCSCQSAKTISDLIFYTEPVTYSHLSCFYFYPTNSCLEFRELNCFVVVKVILTSYIFYLSTCFFQPSRQLLCSSLEVDNTFI